MKTYNKVQAQFINNFITTYGSLSSLKASDAKAIGMTKEELKKAVAQVRELKRERSNIACAKKSAPSLELQLRKRICEKLTKRFEAGFSYRQPSSGWVSVNNTIRVKLLDGTVKQTVWVDIQNSREYNLVAIKDSSFEVSQETKRHEKHWNWKAIETDHVLYLNPLDDFTTAGGILTIFRKADRNLSAIPCKWYEQGRGFDVKTVAGFLVGDYHIEAESAEKALKIVERRRKIAANAIEKQRALAEKRDEAVLTASDVHKHFGFCMPGIRNFCELNGLDPKGKYILKDLRNVVVANRSLNCGRYESYLQKLGITLNCK